MPLQRQTHPWSKIARAPRELEGGVCLSLVNVEGHHARLRFEHEGHAVELRARWLSVPYPSGLRRLLATDPEVEAVVVERVPRGFDAAARDLGVSYIDLRGRGRVVAPGFVYVAPPRPLDRPVYGREDLPAKSIETVDTRSGGSTRRASPFAPKASRIVRALLAEPRRGRRLSELARELDLDPGNSHRILATLVEDGLLERDDGAYAVPDPGSLLEAWAEHARDRRGRLQIPVAEDLVSAVAELLAPAGEDMVVSGELAAELFAPHLPARSALVHCISDRAWREAAGVAEQWTPPLRAECRIEVARSDEGLAHFSRFADGLRLAAPPQVYVDLARERGRGREAAEHLRREVLGY